MRVLSLAEDHAKVERNLRELIHESELSSVHLIFYFKVHIADYHPHPEELIILPDKNSLDASNLGQATCEGSLN